MKKSLSFLLLLSGLASFTACERKELPVPAHDPGNVTTGNVNMESDYRYQVYYNLKTNSVVGQNLKTAWDLGFEASADGWHVVLNGAKSMFVLPITKTNLADVSIADTAGYVARKIWDAPSGSFDSTAIGDWRNTTNSIYIVDRGYNPLGQHLGIEKVQIQSSDATSYTIAYGDINATTSTTQTITKDSAYNFMFVSFDDKATIMVEPPKATWDLAFTQYTHTFYNPYMPYLVTGCLLNHYNTVALAVDSTSGFAGVNYEYLTGKIFSSNTNTIGYDWKTYTNSVYVTDATKAYIIRDANGFYYKLHFIDFMNTMGEKGNPKWEFQQL